MEGSNVRAKRVTTFFKFFQIELKQNKAISINMLFLTYSCDLCSGILKWDDKEYSQCKPLPYIKSSVSIPILKNDMLGNEISLSAINFKPMAYDKDAFLTHLKGSQDIRIMKSSESLFSFEHSSVNYKSCKQPQTSLSVADILDHASIGCENPWLSGIDTDIDEILFNSLVSSVPMPTSLKVQSSVSFSFSNNSSFDKIQVPPDIKCTFAYPSRCKPSTDPWISAHQSTDGIFAQAELLSVEFLGNDLSISTFRDKESTPLLDQCSSLLSVVFCDLPAPPSFDTMPLLAVSSLSVLNDPQAVKATYDSFPLPKKQADIRLGNNSKDRYYCDVTLNTVASGQSFGGIFEVECDIHGLMEPSSRSLDSRYLYWTRTAPTPQRQFPQPQTLCHSSVAEVVSLKTLIELDDRCHFIELPKQQDRMSECPLTSVCLFTEFSRLDKFRSEVPLIHLTPSSSLLDSVSNELLQSLKSDLSKQPLPATNSVIRWIELSLHKVDRVKQDLPPVVPIVPIVTTPPEDSIPDQVQSMVSLESPRIHTPTITIPVIKQSPVLKTVQPASVIEPSSGNSRSDLDGFVDAYLQIQGCAPVRQEIMPHNLVLSDTVYALERDMIAESVPRESDTKNERKYSGTTLLVSDGLLDSWPELVTELSQQNGIRCVDCVLEAPVSIALSKEACVCLFDLSSLLDDPTSVKQFVKFLTGLVHKWNQIWIIVHSADESAQPAHTSLSALIDLCAAVRAFPNLIILRESNSILSLAHIVFKALEQSLTTSISSYVDMTDDVPMDDTMKCVTEWLGNGIFVAQCEFLQLFPSINYRQAAEILTTSSLGHLSIRDTKNDESLKSFVDIASVHIGLEIL